MAEREGFAREQHAGPKPPVAENLIGQLLLRAQSRSLDVQTVRLYRKRVVTQLDRNRSSFDLSHEGRDIGLALGISCQPVGAVAVAIRPFGARPECERPSVGVGIQ